MKNKGNGVVHEGMFSTQLGLKGIPTLAEEIMVSRNLFYWNIRAEKCTFQQFLLVNQLN